MKQNLKKRGLALFLSVCLLCNMGLPVAAAEPGHTGLCEHHPEHTADCGYSEGMAGTPCAHEHTEDCYKEVTECVHAHTDECYPEAGDSVSAGDATPSDAEQLEPTACTHVCGEDTGCITKILDCPHEHDADCGYTEAVEGTPCGYVCAECAAEPEKDSGVTPELGEEICVCTERCGAELVNEDCPVCKADAGSCTVPEETDGLTIGISSWEWVDPDGNLTDGVLALPGVSEDNQAAFADITALLPTALTGTMEGEDEPATVEITGWTCESYTQDEGGNWPVSGNYVFAAALAEGYTAAPAPAVTVELGVANVLAANNTMTQGGITIIASNGGEVSYTEGSGFLLIGGNYTVSGTWSGSLTNVSRDNPKSVITVQSGAEANIILNGVNINVNSMKYACAFDVNGATVNLTLAGTNTLQSGAERAGVEVRDGSTLIITAESIGILNAMTPGDDGGAAAIGSVRGFSGGNITINGGTVNVTVSTSTNGAGIGGGVFGSGGNITINGGSINVTMRSSTSGAGIGGGISGAGGTIIINGGTVMVTGNGVNTGAGIGGGESGAGGNITISGGTVTVTVTKGGFGGAGIGGGRYGASAGTIAISGGIINATGYAGIGGNGGDITISGGNVTATGRFGAGIGGSTNGTIGNIIISGGMVTATGGNGSAGIGGGYDGGSFNTINISNAIVSATGSDGGEHIGNGNGGSGGSCTVSDSLVIKGDTGEVTGNASIPDDFTIESGVTVTIGQDTSLTVNSGATLTNNGTITNNGTLTNNGIIKNHGTINGTNDPSGTVQAPSTVTVTFSKENEAITSAIYGDTITITATAAQRTKVLARSAAINTVDFWLGAVTSGTKLNTQSVSVNGGTATLEIKLEGAAWKPSSTPYTITADFGGTSGTSGLLENTGSATLTINKATPEKPAAPTKNAATDTTVTLNTVDAQKYLYTTNNTPPTADVGDWQTATGTTYQFTGLTPNTEYHFWTYIPGDDYYNNSDVSSSIKITTDKSDDQKAVEAAKSAIESGTYTIAQTTANTADDVKAELASLINALPDMSATGITVAEINITVNSFNAATAGDADDADGTNGSFSFTVALSKGGGNTAGSATTDSKTGTITATAFTGQTNAQAVAAAKSAIEGGSYTMAQTTANTQDGVKTELASQINALQGMSATGITVTTNNITISPFSAATAGDADDADGTDGSFSFTVSLSKGMATNTTDSKTGTITATAFTGQTNAQAVAAAKSAIESVSDWTVAQTMAYTEQEVKDWIADRINALDGMGATGIYVTADNITLNPFTAAQEGNSDNRPGKNGSFSFTVSLTKGGTTDTTTSKTGTITATRYAKPDITTDSLSDGELGTSYSQTLAATGDGTITWSIEGILPDGLALNSSTGTISGTPTKAGTFPVMVRATNSSGDHGKSLAITILTVAPTVKWPTASLTYGQTLNNATLTGGSATGVGGETVAGAFTWENGSTAPVVSDSGTTNYKMTFTPNGGNAGNYNTIAKNDMTVTVEPKELTLTLTAAPASGATAKQDVTLTATLTGAVGNETPAGTITFKRNGVTIQSGAVISSGAITATATWSGVPGGTHNLTAEYVPADSDNYKGGNTATLNGYSVSKANQTGFAFTGGDSVSKQFGSGNFTVSTTGGQSTGDVTYEVTSGTDVIRVDSSSGEVAILKAGTAIITATKAGDSDYNPATATLNVTITQAAGALEISCASVEYGTSPTPQIVSNKGGAVTYSYTGRGGTGYGPSADAPTDAGTYTVTGAAAATENYAAATDSADFEITKASVTVKAIDRNIKIGEEIPDLASPEQNRDYTVSGLIGQDKLTTAPTMSYTGTPDNTKTGSYIINISSADAGGNYTVAFETGTLTVAANPLTGVLAITGTPRVGETLTASLADTNNTGSLTYRWLNNNEVRATGESYTLQTIDKGHQLTVEVTSSVQSGAISKLTDTIQPRSTGGGGSSDSSGDNHSGGSITVQPSDPAKPDSPTTGVITPGKPDKDGNVEIPTAQVTDTINKATADAQKNGTSKNGVAVAVNLPTGAASATLNRAALDKLIASGAKSFQLNFGGISMSFDLAALKEMAAQTTGTLKFSATQATGLTGDVLAAIGTRPAYQLTVTGQKGGKAVTVTSFGAGRVSLAFSYTPAKGEQTGGLYLVRAEQNGAAVWLYQSSYDTGAKRLIGSTNHFSIYGVGYKTPPAFTDTATHWAKDDIDFAAIRGLLSGTSATTFTPNGSMTRGMFVTALGRLAGIDPAAYSSSRFTDVPATAYYAPYVAWAVSKGIVNGTGDQTFSPNAVITREQMAVMMQRYAEKLGYTLPVAREAEIFADEGQITGSMKDAVRAIQQAGVMNGKDGHRFGPKDTATRAEAAAVLRRFVEVVIDPATADGWTQNDAGNWLYYENHKPVTGWKQIESKWYYFDAAGLMQAGGWRQIGGKWYYFYADGSMAVNTKIDGFEIGADGVRKDS